MCSSYRVLARGGCSRPNPKARKAHICMYPSATLLPSLHPLPVCHSADKSNGSMLLYLAAGQGRTQVLSAPTHAPHICNYSGGLAAPRHWMHGSTSTFRRHATPHASFHKRPELRKTSQSARSAGHAAKQCTRACVCSRKPSARRTCSKACSGLL